MYNLYQMQLSGKIIGCHIVSHPVMSKLSKIKQNEEIEHSFNFLESNLQLDLKTYCHPFGGFRSFNEEIVIALAKKEAAFSFKFESRDIFEDDLTQAIQFLPRYDCNEFPLGKAS